MVILRGLGSPLQFRYIAIEGPAGLGKSLLADRLGARLDATVVLDETENPFLADFYAERPGAGFQAQLFFTLSRHRQQTSLRQSDLFSQLTICDYLFDRDKIYAYLNLDDNELFIYQRLYELLVPDLPSPDLVIYLQTPTDVLRRRLRERERTHPDLGPLADDYVRELNEAYNHYFFHYNATPLLVVETSQFDLSWGEDALTDLERQLRGMGKGTRYLRTKSLTPKLPRLPTPERPTFHGLRRAERAGPYRASAASRPTARAKRAAAPTGERSEPAHRGREVSRGQYLPGLR